MPIKNAPVIDAMKALSARYPRSGSRRIRVMLARDGIVLGKGRCAGGQVPGKKRRRRIAGSRWSDKTSQVNIKGRVFRYSQ